MSLMPSEQIMELLWARLRPTLAQWAQTVKLRSQALCPVETGTLRDSVHVTTRDRSVTVTYDAPYAGAVHERTGVPYQSGQSKFLERAVRETRLDVKGDAL
jgi:uncharacterized protein YijF (DUF1287 family)